MAPTPIDRSATGRVGVALLLVVAVNAACASSGQQPSGGQSPTATPTPAASATMVPESASEPTALPTSDPGPFSGSVTVVLKDLQFVLPTGTQTMEVAAGTTVIFRNDDFHSHTVTDGDQGIPSEAPLFDFKLVPGASNTFTFDAPGTYTITCKPHPGMNMTVEVIEP